jgi:hypothetical protein
MKKQIWAAALAASSLVLSGCGNDGSAKDNGSINSNDADKMRTHFQCSQAAKAGVSLTKNAEQVGTLTPSMADQGKRSFATISAAHQLVNSQLLSKYNNTASDEINKIAFKSGEDLKSEIESSKNKVEYIMQFLDTKCGGTELYMENNKFLENSDLKNFHDQLYEEVLAGE